MINIYLIIICTLCVVSTCVLFASDLYQYGIDIDLRISNIHFQLAMPDWDRKCHQIEGASEGN